MNNIKIRLSKQIIKEEDLIDIQKKFNIKFPQNYKNLIFKYNGGITEDSEFFKGLLSIKFGNNTVESIINTHQIVEKNIPKELLPIAYDWSGNIITLSLKEGADSGKIYAFYFDVDRVEKIADSLEELLGVKNIDEL